MPELGSSGSVRGVLSNGRSYREPILLAGVKFKDGVAHTATPTNRAA